MANSNHANGSSPAAAPIHILLVDDASIIVDRLTVGLGAITGVTIVGASPDSDQAIRDIERLEPDVIVLDIQLGKGNGWDVLQYVRCAKPETLVFVFSNNSAEQTRQRFIAGGADRFFDKSREFSQLRHAVQDIISQRFTQ